MILREIGCGVALLACAAAAIACGGDDDDAADAAVEIDASLDLCPLAPGTSYVASTLIILPGDEGFDLDGDAVIDNEIGNLPDVVKASAHAGFMDALQSGETIVLAHIDDWTDPPTPNDDSVGVHVLSGYDADEDGDPSNNFSGDANFFARVEGFDLNCNPAARSDMAYIEDNLVHATRSEWSFAISGGVGTLRFTDAQLEIALADDYGDGKAKLGAIMTLCSLSALPFPGEIEGTILDAFANDDAIGGFVQVDMDLDGDGLEQVIGDGVTIKECIDGDGVTVIPGRDCPCHPAIADGYSAAISLDVVSAHIIGVR